MELVVALLILGSRRHADGRGVMVTGNRLSDCRRVAAAFRDIAKQGETGADAAVVWADGDEFAFMGIEVSHGDANFSSLYETGFEHRVSSCSVCYGD